MRHIIAYAGLSLGLMAGPTLAQQAGPFELQLVDAKSQNNACSIIMRVKNTTGVNIAEAHYEVQGLDSKDMYKGSFNLNLGEIKSGKERFVHFDLAGMACEDLARLHANGFTSCKGDKDYLDLCNGAAKVSSAIALKFNDDAGGG